MSTKYFYFRSFGAVRGEYLSHNFPRSYMRRLHQKWKTLSGETSKESFLRFVNSKWYHKILKLKIKP